MHGQWDKWEWQDRDGGAFVRLTGEQWSIICTVVPVGRRIDKWVMTLTTRMKDAASATSKAFPTLAEAKRYGASLIDYYCEYARDIEWETDPKNPSTRRGEAKQTG